MPDRPWKAAEREVAAAIGGRRTYFAGADGDAASGWCVADVKRRKRYSLTEARENLARLQRPNDARLAILVHFDEPGRGRRRDPVVIMRLADFRDWFGDEASLARSAGSRDVQS